MVFDTTALANQARQYATTRHPVSKIVLAVDSYVFEQKFAQLIVFECVKAVMDGTKEGDHYAQRIEQHFDNGTGGILHFGVEP